MWLISKQYKIIQGKKNTLWNSNLSSEHKEESWVSDAHYRK